MPKKRIRCKVDTIFTQSIYLKFHTANQQGLLIASVSDLPTRKKKGIVQFDNPIIREDVIHPNKKIKHCIMVNCNDLEILS